MNQALIWPFRLRLAAKFQCLSHAIGLYVHRCPLQESRSDVLCMYSMYYVCILMYFDVFSRAILFSPLAFALIVVYICMYFACILYVFSVTHLKIHLALTRAFAEYIVCSFPYNTSSNVCVWQNTSTFV